MDFIGNIYGPGDVLGNVAGRIRRLEGIESAAPDKNGTIVAVANTGGIDRGLRQEALALGKRAMVPVRVFYRMPDGRMIGEEDFSNEDHQCRHCVESATKKLVCSRGFAPTCDEHESTARKTLLMQGYHLESIVNLEAIEDFYTRVYVDGFAGDKVEAPPEEVAVEPEGAKKLQRIRSNGPGNPVVGYKIGNMECGCGSTVKFKKGTTLNWTGGKTMNVKKGAVGHVYEMSAKHPLGYLQIGQYSGVQLPMHAIGHLFDVMVSEAKEKLPEYPTLDYQRLVNTIGFGHVMPQQDTPNNHPTRDRRRTRRVGAHQSAGTQTSEAKSREEEDFLLPPDKNNPERPEDPIFKGSNKGRRKIILQRK
jgi:hypothetical protein